MSDGRRERGVGGEVGRGQVIQAYMFRDLDSILSSVGNDLLFLHRVVT